MFFIRNFPCHLDQTVRLSEWLTEVATALETVSYNLLRFMVHEGFVNACKFSEDHSAHVTVVINKSDIIEIAITDSGKGFRLFDSFGNFDMKAYGLSSKVLDQPTVEVMATVEDSNAIRFYLAQKQLPGTEEAELSENRRGLISILRASKKLYYYYSPGSYNYLHITC